MTTQKPPKPTASEWLKANLFNNWYNSLLSLIFIGLILWAGFYGFRFLFFTGKWEAVRENLTLFMIGRFPRAEQWRVLVQICLLASAIGLAWGITRAKRVELEPSEARFKLAHLKGYWAAGLLVAVLLLLTQTFLPLLFVIGALACLFGFLYLGLKTPKSLRGIAWFIAGVLTLMSWHILSGTQGSAWWWAAALVSYSVLRFLLRREAGWLQILPVLAGAIVAVWALYTFLLDIEGVSWGQWSGFHLNLVATSIAIAIAFPMGLILAMGRRSKLPVVSYMSVTFIEAVRGVPLITLLFMGNLFLGFFIDQASELSNITRAIFVMALFTSAYLAEIFRGGLRAVPAGQIDAAKAVGLGPFQAMLRIIFPQALRAVIPALVGQSISLFKDSSLLTVISIVELLRVRTIVHSQPGFTVIGIAETLVFVSFAFWAISYTMSRESRRLETRLGVGI